MNANQTSTLSPAPTADRRVSQLHYLCHFLDVFASGDPVMRAAAFHYGERLRDEGCDSNGVIRMAATALLVAIERDIEEQTSDLIGSQTYLNDSSMSLPDSHDSFEERHERAA